MIELQRLLLGDVIRNETFHKALRAVIVPGKTIVADIGSGTGFLSFLAENMGAKECFLYEVSPGLLTLSKRIAKDNDIRRCTFVAQHSTTVKNPPKADVVISETLGNHALEENIIETMNDARRFLKPGGVMIPRSLKQFVAPVKSSSLYDALNVWDHVSGDLDFSAAKEVCMNNMYVKEIVPDDLLPHEPAVQWDAVDFTQKNISIREKTVEWKMKKDVELFGFALWWEATLIEGITLTTSPFKSLTHWKQIYLPLLDPLPIRAGHSIRLNLRSDSRYTVKINVQRETSLLDRNGKTLKSMKQDMRKGMLS